MKNKKYYNKLWKENNHLDCMKGQDFSKNLLKYTNSKPKDWKNKSVFEAGAGIGNGVIGALNLGIKDISVTELTKNGVNAIVNNTASSHEKINYIYEANLCNLNREDDNKFDIVFATNCISIIQEYKKAISEMVRICKPNGLIMFNVSPTKCIGSVEKVVDLPFHKEFTEEEITQILEELNCKIITIDDSIAVKAKKKKIRKKKNE